MRLREDLCWRLLGTSGHGALSTVHATRGVDAVPVAYLAMQGELAIPIDTVKDKAPGRLQRARNLDEDARCVLLIEHYEDDWSKLWWVRVHGNGSEVPDRLNELRPAFARFFPRHYRHPEALDGLLIITPTRISGWAARMSALG